MCFERRTLFLIAFYYKDLCEVGYNELILILKESKIRIMNNQGV